MATAQTNTVTGTAREIIEYLQSKGDDTKYLLIEEPSLEAPLPRLTAEEEEALLDELGTRAKGRLDPALKYDREDIYFDQFDQLDR